MCALDPVVRAVLCALLGLRRNQLVARIPSPARELGVQVELVKLVEAKKEEKVRLKQQQKQAALEAKNLAKKPATIKVTLPTVTTETLNEEK
ncbi:hypothetical protein AgCh_032499 [Apium graveolens]